MTGQRDLKDLVMLVRQQLETGKKGGGSESADDPEGTLPGDAVSEDAVMEQPPAGVAEPEPEEEVAPGAGALLMPPEEVHDLPADAPPSDADVPDTLSEPGDSSADAYEAAGEEVPEEGEPDEGEREPGEGESDEVPDLAELILPEPAVVDVEDLHLDLKSRISDLIDETKLPSGIEVPPPEPAPTAVAAEAAAAQAVPDEEVAAGPKRRLKFPKLKMPGIREVIAPRVEEYDPAVHGPLVDLSFSPPPSVEEIELYPVNEPYAYIRITYDTATHEYTYNVLEPGLTPAETELLKELKERLFERLETSTKSLDPESARALLRNAIVEIIRDYGITLSQLGMEKIFYHVVRDFLGEGLIDAIMHDRYIEDISCDGVGTPLFIYHIRYESLRTNLVYGSAEDLDSFVVKLAQRAGKYISIADPMLDATMSDGSRIQMTLGSEVTAHGSTFTIRKFKDEPITPTDLIEWSTFSPLSVAYFWLAVESGKSAIFAGGTASGKTTSLNALALFIPPLAKIVSIEDTRELKLPHPNWIPGVTRESFDIAGRGSIDMYDLLRAALRQRPEYIIVGEVRGKEAVTLFQAMSTGHVTYATMHADSVASAVHRLENPPIDVPRNMLTALDIICIQVQARVGGQRIRRCRQVIEVLDLDPRTKELITNEVFSWDQPSDEIRFSRKSYILDEIRAARGWTEERMAEELKRRQEVLEWMRIKKIRHYQDVSRVLISYHRDPEATMAEVRADLYERV